MSQEVAQPSSQKSEGSPCDGLKAQLQDWLKPVLGGRPPQQLWLPEHDAAVSQFLAGAPEQCLFACLDQAGRLCLGGALPEQAASAVLFVLQDAIAVLAQPLPSSPPPYIHGLLDPVDVMGSLVQLMGGLFSPSLEAASEAWPDTLASDLVLQLDKFQGCLMETYHAQHGLTVLFVPTLPGDSASAAAREREVVQRLESCLLRWTEQIGELLSRQGSDELLLDEGPLAEIAFWTGRAADLGGIRQQLWEAGLQRILKVLELAKSPYLGAFMSLGESIQQAAARAESNVKLLALLEEPCTKLAGAEPAAVPALLPGILDLLRLIWTLSPHYHTPDRMASLLRKVSNEVIARCRASIDLGMLFSGLGLDVAEAALQCSIDTAAEWKTVYTAAAARVNAQAPPGQQWAAGGSSGSFAHVDAFVQRCQDLQEMCAAQRQFAPHPRLPAVLSGPRAAETSKALGEVQASFGSLMARFQGLPYDALDVKNSLWYEDMAAFRSTTQDLELMLGNVVGTALDNAATLCLKLEVLEAFHSTATREGLKKCIEVRMTEWHVQFIAEMNQVKDLFEAVKVQLPVGVPLPHSAGQALIMKGLLKRIERTWDSLQNVVQFLPTVPNMAESSAAYDALHAGLQQSINNLNTRWYRGVSSDLASTLSGSLLRQDKASGLLAVNMDEQLATVLEEAYLFERLRLGVPGGASELLAQRHRLLSEWGSMAGMVRQYNHLLQTLSKEERRLFKDRIRHLDRRVLPGVNKLNWSTPKPQVDYLHREATLLLKQTSEAVLELKATSVAVARACAAIKSTLLVHVERKRLYDLPDFEAQQAQYQAVAKGKLEEAYMSVREVLVSLYRFVARDSEEVQQEWLRFLQKVDGQVLEALAAAVRRSLSEVARALNGDKKSHNVSPVFVLSVVLEASNRVELNPTLQNLFDTVSGVCKRAVALVDGIPRVTQDVIEGCASTYGKLPSLLTDAPLAPPFVELINKNEDAVLKQMQAVTAAITGIVDKVQQFLVYWEKKFRQTYEQDKDAYMRRYERANKPVAAFEADIAKFRDLSEEVLAEEAATSMSFLRLDCAPLKQMLAAHCEMWIAKFAALLHTMACKQLDALHDALAEHTASLAADGEGSETLQERLGKLLTERPELQAKLVQCKEKYEALEKLQFSIPDEELDMLQNLPGVMDALERSLEAAQGH